MSKFDAMILIIWYIEVSATTFKQSRCLRQTLENDSKKEKILDEANVIVFGHTHMPGMSSPDVEKTFGKRFVNSGSWVAEDPKCYNAVVEHREYNTLVYIDSEGPLLLQWGDKKGTVHQLTQYAKGEGTKKKWWQFWKTSQKSILLSSN